jgi:hypothetical protein
MSAAAVLEAPKLETSNNVSVRLTAEEAAALERYALTKKMSAEQVLEEFVRERLTPLIADQEDPQQGERRKAGQDWRNRDDLGYDEDDDPDYLERHLVWERALEREDLWGSEEDKRWDE